MEKVHVAMHVFGKCAKKVRNEETEQRLSHIGLMSTCKNWVMRPKMRSYFKGKKNLHKL